MKRIFVCILILLFLAPCKGFSNAMPVWSKTGHRVIGAVAEKHLNRKARKAIDKILGGRTLAEVSNFADDIKADRSFGHFSPWHYVNLPSDERYLDSEPSPEGDVVMGIEKCVQILKDPTSYEEDVIFYLKMLVHLVGDLHQPMHVGKLADKGGNDIQVQWFGRGSNLHRVWDANLIDDYGMSYTELAQSLPRWEQEKVNAALKGSVYDWVEEVQLVTNRLYESAESGEKLSYRYRFMWWDTVEEQLLLGGLRLAAVLNDIYG
jgi:hypothetical protein